MSLLYMKPRIIEITVPGKKKKFFYLIIYDFFTHHFANLVKHEALAPDVQRDELHFPIPDLKMAKKINLFYKKIKNFEKI